MIQHRIQAWFASQGSYLEGVNLYAEVGEKRTLQGLRQYLAFSMVPERARTELEQALRQHLGASPAPPPVPEQPAPKKLVAEEPGPVQQLRRQAIPLLRERDAHRAQLVQMAADADKYTDADRYLLAETIMVVQKEIDEVYQRIERYHDEGEVPEVGSTSKIVRESVEKYQRVLSIRSAISRLNKRLNNPPDDLQQQADQTDLLAKQVELNTLLEELGIQD
jgi:hypothetical protein